MERLLELVVEILKALPEMAIWVLLMILVYKITIIGSIFGLIRFCGIKIHDAVIAVISLKKEKQDAAINVRGEIDKFLITDAWPLLKSQLERLVNSDGRLASSYIHRSDIKFLKDALDAQFDKERADKK